jgi:hypothetical protein
MCDHRVRITTSDPKKIRAAFRADAYRGHPEKRDTSHHGDALAEPRGNAHAPAENENRRAQQFVASGMRG